MNKDRRKAIEVIKDRMSEISGLAADLRVEIEAIRDEEQEYFDGMPESFQSGEKGQAAEAAVSSLETACEQLEEIESSVEAISQSLDEAAS